MIKVLIVDDHQMVRFGTRRLLEDESGLQIVGEASSGEEASRQSMRSTHKWCSWTFRCPVSAV